MVKGIERSRHTGQSNRDPKISDRPQWATGGMVFAVYIAGSGRGQRANSGIPTGGEDGMSGSFHEQLRHEEVKPPSERSTGTVFAVVAVVLAALYRDMLPVAVAFAGVSVVLGLLSWRSPQVLKPLNILWFKLGMLMHRIVNPVVMLAMFAVAVVPAGLLMQRFRDPLVKRRKPAGESYWVDIEASRQLTASMRQQF